MRSTTPPTAHAAINGQTVIAAQTLNRDKDLIWLGKWNQSDDPKLDLRYEVRAFEHHPQYHDKGVRLAVFDGYGALVYEDQFSGISRIDAGNFLRNKITEMPQLVIEVNFGGNSDFLQVLKYQDGKISNLTPDVDNFGSHVEVRPQFRSSTHPAIEPYQILLTNPGLASPGEKYTTVYRYKDGAYRLFGHFSQTRVDDFIEELLAEDISARNRQAKSFPRNRK